MSTLLSLIRIIVPSVKVSVISLIQVLTFSVLFTSIYWSYKVRFYGVGVRRKFPYNFYLNGHHDFYSPRMERYHYLSPFLIVYICLLFSVFTDNRKKLPSLIVSSWIRLKCYIICSKVWKVTLYTTVCIGSKTMDDTYWTLCINRRDSKERIEGL